MKRVYSMQTGAGGVAIVPLSQLTAGDQGTQGSALLFGLSKFELDSAQVHGVASQLLEPWLGPLNPNWFSHVCLGLGKRMKSCGLLTKREMVMDIGGLHRIL